MDIGDRIRNLRNEKGMTLRDLGERIGMSVSFISDVENSRSSPSLKRCKEIAAGLNVPVSLLLGEQSQQNPVVSSNGTYSVSFSGLNAMQVSELLHDFDNWDTADQQELIAYLNAKKAVRSQN